MSFPIGSFSRKEVKTAFNLASFTRKPREIVTNKVRFECKVFMVLELEQ